MTTLETLKAARKLIANKKRWTQNEVARGKSGRPVNSDSRYATCWCSIGSIWNVTGGIMGSWSSEDYLSKFMEGNTAVFNDTHTHAEVLAAFDEAIARLEAK